MVLHVAESGGTSPGTSLCGGGSRRLFFSKDLCDKDRFSEPSSSEPCSTLVSLAGIHRGPFACAEGSRCSFFRRFDFSLLAPFLSTRLPRRMVLSRSPGRRGFSSWGASHAGHSVTHVLQVITRIGFLSICHPRRRLVEEPPPVGGKSSCSASGRRREAQATAARRLVNEPVCVALAGASAPA